MPKNLVIVESPAKAKTINKILGADYRVLPSLGHVRDLPEKRLGVNVEKNFEPEYVTLKDREKILRELRAAAKGAHRVYLAPDPDREGEAIAWHLQAALQGLVPAEQFLRVTYNEITAPAIRRAFAAPRALDMNRVNSQQARRVLDRLVGYQVSRMLWRRIRGATSAGRVQSVALRLVCEREREVLNFVPREFWVVAARLAKQTGADATFVARLAKVDGRDPEIAHADAAAEIKRDLETRSLRVKQIIRREISKRAPPPFITSALQQAGARLAGFSPSRTMRLAQKLYEGVDSGAGPVGLITYMRTDSFNVAREAQESCARFITEQFGRDYLPEKPNVYRSRGSAQEAHEAIRPTDVARTPETVAGVLDADELKLYRIIWQRFVASQMAPARIAQRTAEIEALAAAPGGREYLFRATASDVVFPGYLKASGGPVRPPREAEEDAADEEDGPLPPLEENELLDCREWLTEQKFTQPPPRYGEATLVRAMEENGIGRPSTYAQILSTLQAREYVTRDRKVLKPTERGFQVCDFLVQHLPKLFEVQFTALMEAELDDVEEGKREWTHMLGDFYKDFVVWLKDSRGPDGNAEEARQLLDLLGRVTEWAPATRRGKREYNDAKFVQSIREQLEKGEKALSQTQVTALKKLAARYRPQLAGAEEQLAALGVPEIQPPTAAELAAQDIVRRKLDALRGVTFRPPRQVGKRTFDDAAFAASLREQAEGGRALSFNQVRYLDRLIGKYRDQIPADRLPPEPENSSAAMDAAAQAACAGLLADLAGVTAWKPPTQRGRRVWDDRKFYESLAGQFKDRGELSERQLAALRKMHQRYMKSPAAPVETTAEA